jgi:HSP20 family molecular chaperone IbpA
MFKKIECKRCKKKIHSQYEFCPYCGISLNENFKKDWGMLGKSDEMDNAFGISNSMFGGDMFGKMLSGAMRMLQKEMQKEIKNNNFKPRTNLRLMINGKEVNLNNIQNQNKFKSVKKEIKNIKLPSMFSQENMKKFSSLPREEPLTNIRRLSDKMIYEINLAGVKSINDITIIKLENSIEIKAIAKDKSYFKLISISLPIMNYNFSKGKLVLEFEVK